MRVLILSCNTGEGHNSCAKALKESFEQEGHFCVIKDSLAYISEFVSTLISRGHVFIYRYTPFVFSVGYKLLENHSDPHKKNRLLYKLLSCGKKKLAGFLQDGDFDLVVCTHAFSAIILTEALKLVSKEIVTALISTDYTCNPTSEYSDLDYYVIPDESLKATFVGRGVPADSIVCAGIPVRTMFYDKARCDRINVENKKHLLVMSGSMGCGPVNKFVAYTSRLISDGEIITVVCGTNKRLYNKLSKRYYDCPNIHILGYVSDIASLMHDADLYYTKPGGISTSEAKTMSLPMVFSDSVAGCEEHNCNFFVDRGCAITDDNVKALSYKSVALLRDDTSLNEMSSGFDDLDKRNSSDFIRDFLIERAINKNTV